MSGGPLSLVQAFVLALGAEPPASASDERALPVGAAVDARPAPSADWVELRSDGAHLTVDFTPTLDRLWPDDDTTAAEALESPLPSIAPAPDDDDSWGTLSFFVLPDVRYNPDEGLGLGVAIPIIWSEPGVEPYKYNFVFQLVTSTKLVQDQALLFDLVDLFGLPLRLSGQAGFYAFADEPFCGVGSTARCDPSSAARAGDVPGPPAILTDEERLEREERHYLMRIVRPYVWSTLRYELFELHGKWEAFAGLRSEAYFPGFFGEVLNGELWTPGPYEGSLLEERDRHGEPGFVNVPQLGIMVDSRDFEPSPRSGYWVEGSVRGAHPWLLSSWGFLGVNVTARHYAPLLDNKRLTLATRLIADVIVGDAPVQELARFGGSVDYRGFGGRWVGRGMRQQRYVGHVKLAYQSELRWDAIELQISSFTLGFEFVAFVDAGTVLAEGVDYDFRSGLVRPLRPLLTAGGGLRWVINKNIVIRIDAGVSPEEGFVPQFYFDGRHIF